MNESQKHICKHVIFDLKQSQKGIINIKHTYINDLKVCCDLDTLLQEIEAFLSTVDNTSRAIDCSYSRDSINSPIYKPNSFIHSPDSPMFINSVIKNKAESKDAQN